MKSNHAQGRLGKAIIMFSLVCGFALAASTNAQAQYSRGQRDDRSDQGRRNRDWNRNRDDRHRDRDDRNQGRNDDYRNGNGQYGRGNGQNNVYRIAQQQGYQAGLNTGASDGQRGQSYDPQRSHYYRSATDGYSSSYGNKEAYKQAYRDAFTQGYREGFQRYDGNRNGRNYPRSNNTGSILGGIFGRP